MKIILLQDIETLGKANQIVDVKPGYANNFLIKKGFALRASDKNMEKLDEEVARIAAEKAQILADAETLKESLDDKTFKVVKSAGPDGKLYGSVTSKEIADEIKADLGIDIDRRKVVFEPIKTPGTYNALIKLHSDVEANVFVIVAVN
ncbi:MAG: 50S ribosomal protein L9 [Eubacteriaceae bacterium]|nr:50S ribosomal protein L9 [Eubacteriaceae bacterium]